MAKRTSLPAAIRRAVYARDNHRCCKCGRRTNLEVHHLLAVMDGGTDDLDNLITLCSVCHDEWEMVEKVSRMSFDTWLPLPTAMHLLYAFMGPWPDDVSAREAQHAILQTHQLRFSMDE